MNTCAKCGGELKIDPKVDQGGDLLAVCWACPACGRRWADLGGAPSACVVATPDTLGGMPRIDGTRIGVTHVLARLLECGTPGVLDDYPHLTPEQIRGAVEYACKLVEDRRAT